MKYRREGAKPYITYVVARNIQFSERTVQTSHSRTVWFGNRRYIAHIFGLGSHIPNIPTRLKREIRHSVAHCSPVTLDFLKLHI